MADRGTTGGRKAPRCGGPSKATQGKIDRALALLRAAFADPAHDWEAQCALGRAMDAIRQANGWTEQAERNRVAQATADATREFWQGRADG